MDDASQYKIMNIKVPADARALLEKWAEVHLTSMNAELVRAIRERAKRERQEKAIDR